MNKEDTISAYILCGGTNSRMQTEKGLIIYKGKTFIDWVIDAIKPITNSIFLVTRNDDYKKFGYPLIPDTYPNKGPVGGIYTALLHTNTDTNIILSCDIPKITSSVLKTYLVDKFDKSNTVLYVADNNRTYPLIGLYSKKLVTKFETAINNDHLKLVRLLEKINCKCVKTKPEDYNALQNINTIEELKILIKNT
ncbi:molybdenum cofactor guanylyltransferase [Winogradskyella sp.]|uniref:molybdenum cofactor guanylyltransferase n=1 Tax=Winogradskyella sp. TaxID=1883156 RepID=UPI0025E6B0D4|nr:molybdenum cofactor guanylyltransferase [Winogradskyella sp.]